MNGKRVVIRTLDIGADKQVDYFDMKEEENPALGVRAIRICLNRPEVFRTQLRALYRASVYGKIAIMFPMITSVWEVKECKRACMSVMKELEAEGIPYDKDTELEKIENLGVTITEVDRAQFQLLYEAFCWQCRMQSHRGHTPREMSAMNIPTDLSYEEIMMARTVGNSQKCKAMPRVS